jgi:hypothetical protein
VRGRLPLQKPLAGPGCQSNRGYPAFEMVSTQPID